MPRDVTTTPTLRLNSPPAVLSPEEQIKYLVRETNQEFEKLTKWIQDITGVSGKSPPFAADVDLGGHRLLNMADPVVKTDGANRRYVDEKHDDQEEQIQEILETLHNELPLPGNQTILLTRDVPTTVDDTIGIGSFKLTADAHAFDIAITVSVAGFSVAKAYTIVTNYAMNADWEMALPLVDTGPFGVQDFALDVWEEADAKLSLRLRRVSGTIAATATIHITPRGHVNDLFVESSATASVTPPTALLESARLMVKDGDLLFNTSTTRELVVSDTTFTISGVEGEDERPGLALTNRSPGTDSFTGEIRLYAGDTLVGTVSGRTDGATDAGLLSFFTKETGVGIALALRITSLKNVIVGGGVASGANGEKVFVVGTGVPPTTSPADSWQAYSADIVAGNAAPHFLTEALDLIRLFKGAALTAEDASVVDGTYGTQEQNVINNLRLRLGELELRLQAHGLLG